jgi:PleD family two-component response regulator
LVEKKLREIWKDSLSQEGYAVICSEDLKRAIELVLNQPPDLLIVQYDLAPSLVYDLIAALKDNLHLAFLPIILVISSEGYDLDWESYPVDDFIFTDVPLEELLARLRLAFARAQRLADNNPLTGLPGNTSILKYIQRKLDRGEEIAIGYIDLDNFKPFNDRYGFSRGDEILRALGRILSNVVRLRAGEKGFVGHIGETTLSLFALRSC